jgi:hypothetical protein
MLFNVIPIAVFVLVASALLAVGHAIRHAFEALSERKRSSLASPAPADQTGASRKALEPLCSGRSLA